MERKRRATKRKTTQEEAAKTALEQNNWTQHASLMLWMPPMPFQHSCKVQNVVAASHSIHHDSRQRLESSRRLVKSCSDRFRAREICEYFVTPVITAVPSCLFWCKSALDASGSGPPYGHWTRAGRLQRCFLALEVGPCAELVRIVLGIGLLGAKPVV